MSEWIVPGGVNPLDYYGFVYLIVCIETGRKYIGRKYVWSKRRRKGGKRVTTESNWRDYWGSCRELLEDVERLGSDKFQRMIVSLHATKGETNYAEVKEQFARDVLNSVLPDGTREYYNGNIMSRWFSRDRESYDRARDKMSAGVKAYYASGGKHPLQGRVHPNKGKRINSGHQLLKGMRWITNGITSRLVERDAPVPKGWKPGITKKPSLHTRRREAWDKSPRSCPQCKMVLPFEKRHRTYCGLSCKNKAHSERQKGKPFRNLDHGKCTVGYQNFIARKYGYSDYEEAKACALTYLRDGMRICDVARRCKLPYAMIRFIKIRASM